MKILSFIIPAYNSEGFLDKCVSSMLAPELLDKLEILIVNDGSTDTTAAVAEKYCIQYPGTVRLISQENKGHGGALNTGCAAARGKYLKVVDADDWVETQTLPILIAKLEHCDSDVVLTHYHTVDVSTGEVKCWRSYPAEFSRSYTLDEIVNHWRDFERSLTFHGITYRTDFYQELGIQLSEHVSYEDQEYVAFPCCHAKSITPFDFFLYNYRIGDANQGVSGANQVKRIGHTEAVIWRITEEYKKIPEAIGKDYVTMKLQGLLLSYLTTVLLAHPDKKEGRRLAEQRMIECKTKTPAVYGLVKQKYHVFCLLNRLHISKQTWDKLLNSRLYNSLRGNHTFE